ncbi:murein L,D-transpeptidase family protein [Methylotenera sp.]|uniref:L,D-transpeptidase family protein n=2 Tax=Methylotenera sp. TaxID=2051956 RepID=UPI00272371B1|nr:L,D-transpeptidase family protein [Methylotenera sp.]MDO9205695.1 L,D-transpeptidase family protein [Methylotenera sp.]MDP2070040.1 L,D-transpeptidase family protein [Methylotenera sp.]MDP2230036.1 L,D-transpeptidase family protein [Methylotenera sp.]MDP3006507.1 L,D-transpeptidase family protein [Methylotenera sp.]MDP3307376.1 L,D-transpeptidase family protein [Methylotenera sp.]
MVLNKSLTYVILAAITLVPWNATAVNSYSLSNLLHKPKLNELADLAENLLVKSLLEITQGKNQQALNTVDELIHKIPNFKLAYLVRGDLLTAQAQHLQAFGNAGINKPDAVKDLQAEARARIERYLSNENLDKLPKLLLAPSEQQSHIIVVDTDKSRLYLYKNNGGSLSYAADYYVTVGKNGVNKQVEGDKRTPIGVYFTKPKLTQPLADMYGEGAYPLNYPNEWDSRYKRSGYGIWLHGTPSNTYSRPPNASDGCVVLTNQDIKTLAPILQAGNTPVIIANNLKWIDADSSESEKQSLQIAINDWLKDWKSQNTPQYLSHYSQSFSASGINFQQWSNHKFSVQASKPKVEIALSNVSMFAYPDENRKVVVVNFTQDFKSPSLSNKMQKRQYWIQEGTSWKIIYEGAA